MDEWINEWICEFKNNDDDVNRNMTLGGTNKLWRKKVELQILIL